MLHCCTQQQDTTRILKRSKLFRTPLPSRVETAKQTKMTNTHKRPLELQVFTQHEAYEMLNAAWMGMLAGYTPRQHTINLLYNIHRRMLIEQLHKEKNGPQTQKYRNSIAQLDKEYDTFIQRTKEGKQ